ncbi:VOC family protein [Cytobacillus dafuensis]|uniref:VOC family protein n=1 Tax=Cytobacillus dafuensis TaxID=1742359 RepID=A0A5B8Z487_CYTDA|nr:VOC family protein [Cytobacillus dafuensis]QED47875.1 VOC family protein [Cytobacillus dafuensis]
MDLQLDHLVHFISDHPNKAVMEWKKLGYKAVMGGSHESWGTFNSLLYSSTSYIEFIAVENQTIAEQSDNPLIKQLITDLKNRDGIGQICFRTKDLVMMKEQLNKKGITTFPIFPGSRKRQDGSMIRWKMLFIKEKASFPFPFFIEWEQNDEDRFIELKALSVTDKKLENHSVKSVFIACYNAEKTAMEWTRLFDFPIINNNFVVNFSTKSIVLQCGSTELIFCESLNQEGIIHETLKSRGERPFFIQFQPMLFEKPISVFHSHYQ